VIAASHIDMTSQPNWMKQGGEKVPEASDSTQPAFADSLKVAAKAVASEASPVKSGRRSKTDAEDAKPIDGARDGNALATVSVLAQMVPSQVLLPTQTVSDGTAVAFRDACAVADGDSAVESAGRLADATPAGSTSTGAQGVPTTGVLQKSDEGESMRTSVGGDSSNAALAGSAQVNAVSDIGPVTAAMAMPLVATSEAIPSAPREIAVGAASTGATDAAEKFSGVAGTSQVVADPNVFTVVPNAAVAVVDLKALKAGTGAVVGAKAAVEPGLGKAVANVSARTKAGSKTGLKDGFDAKQADKPAPVATEAADVSGDRSQRDGSSQGRGSADVVAPVGHNAAADGRAQSVLSGAAVQTTTASEVSHGHTARTNDVGAAAAVEVAQPLPAINTARLIQSVGQTEMRVGMRSTEFGNISIRTSSTPELMSAEISVDHGDLARMLATHVPEMQAKIGGGQPVHVQIDMSGQNAGSQGGQANGSAADAQGSRPRQHGQDGQASRGSNGGAGAQRYQRESLPVGLMNESSNTRLDVRV
jgi:hypothetical protein